MLYWRLKNLLHNFYEYIILTVILQLQQFLILAFVFLQLPFMKLFMTPRNVFLQMLWVTLAKHQGDLSVQWKIYNLCPDIRTLIIVSNIYFQMTSKIMHYGSIPTIDVMNVALYSRHLSTERICTPPSVNSAS